MYTNFMFANVSEASDYFSESIDINEVEFDEEYHRANYLEIEGNLHNGTIGIVNTTVLAGNKFCPLLFRFVWYTVITGTICILGMTGNTLSIITLQKDRGNQVANLLLQALALADNALLFLSLLTLSIMWGALEYFNASHTFAILPLYFFKYITPVGYITKTCAIWMTVLLAINRYIVIKEPLRAQHICTLWKARMQILAVIIFSIVCNIPRFFRVRIIWITEGNSTIRSYEETSFGKGSLFHIIYTNVLYTISVIILPLIILIFMNVSLILELRRMRHQRNLMSANCRSSDANITLVMCIIIVIFIGCHTPDRILQGIRSFYKKDLWEYYCYLTALCNLLIIISSSSNFLVYFFVRKRFRLLLYQTLCKGSTRRQSDITITMVSQLGDDAELSGPMLALRRLSRSMTGILFKNMDSTRKNDKTVINDKRRANSLGTLLEVHEQHKTQRFHPTGKLLDMKIGPTENDTRLG